METINLKTFFNNIGYDWKKDEKPLEQICLYTKTRVKETPPSENLTWGMEQTFLLKAIAEWKNVNSFFEIGTGRGTACYALALVPPIKRIATFDIIPFSQKLKTAIKYEEAFVSNQDIYDLIPFSEKSKIEFYERDSIDRFSFENKNSFNMCFIDGNHSDPKIIRRDYELAKMVLEKEGVIIFDDYDPKYAVKGVVDRILKEDPKLNAKLIEFRGYLFSGKEKEQNTGIVLI